MIHLNSKNDSLTLLTHLGYLSYDIKNSTVKIPNLEIEGEFHSAISNINEYKIVSDALNLSSKLLDATLNKDETTVSNILEKFMIKTPRYFHTTMRIH